jgi:hypothetical protein
MSLHAIAKYGSYRLMQGGFDRAPSIFGGNYCVLAHIQPRIPDVSFAYLQFTEMYGGTCLCGVIFWRQKCTLQRKFASFGYTRMLITRIG